MIEQYNVERYDEVTAKQLKETGFTSELNAFLAQNGVSKDEIVLAMGQAGDENMKLDGLIGNVKISKSSPEPVVPVEESQSPASDPSAL